MRIHFFILNLFLLNVGSVFAEELPLAPNEGVYIFKADETQYRSPFDKLPVPVPVIEDVNKDGSLSATKMEVRELEKFSRANKIGKTLKREVRNESPKAKEAPSARVPKIEASVTPSVEPQSSEVILASPTIKSNESMSTSFSKPLYTENINDHNESTTDTSGVSNWFYKAMVFFGIGLLLLAAVWYALRRQALHGDPALKDPWFKPIQ